MEYSLRTFIKNVNFQSLTLTQFVNNLNLIGFEIDEIDYQNIKNNPYIQDINILIKIPPNRQDLLNEINFQKEIATIFLLKLNDIWKKVNYRYFFLLNQKYKQYNFYETYQIKSDLNFLNIYSLEIKKLNKTVSPIWIQDKIFSNGIIPTKDFRDLLTLINLEWGQTIDFSNHPVLKSENFYLDKLNQQHFISNKENEIYQLPKGSIVLKNSNNEIINILGVNYFEISNTISNENIMLHAIFYNIYDDLLNLNNLISVRHLRKSFLEYFRFSFQRLLTLLELTLQAEVGLKKQKLVEKSIKIKPYRILTLNKNRLKKFLNSEKFDDNIFKKASLKIICNTPFSFYIQVPDSRKDLLREIDLIEEYSRFLGYKSFKEILPKKELVFSKKQRKNINFIKHFFINYNFFEIINSSLTYSEDSHTIEIINPLNKELSLLRTQLLPNLIDVFLTNIKLDDKNTNFFEIGRVFKKLNQKIIEQEKLAGIFQTKCKNRNLDWFESKGFIEVFLDKFGYKNLIFKKLNIKNNIFHPTRSILIQSNNQTLGIFGEIHPQLRKDSFIKERVYLFEFDLNYLNNWKMNSSTIIYSEISKYPSITKDLSFSISKEQNFYEIKQKVLVCSKLLKNISFFDIYFDEKISKEINIGIRLEFQSKNETLTTETIENEIIAIRKMLITNFHIKFKD